MMMRKYQSNSIGSVVIWPMLITMALCFSCFYLNCSCPLASAAGYSSSWLNSMVNGLSKPVSENIGEPLARTNERILNSLPTLSFMNNNNDNNQPDDDNNDNNNNNRAERGADGGGNNMTKNNEQYDYQAMCLLKRNKAWNSNPALYFFSNKNHSPRTLGCTKEIKFTLDTIPSSDGGSLLNSNTISTRAGENDGDDQDDDDSSQIGREYSTSESRELIKSKLIDSGLYDGNLNTYVMIHGFLASWNSSTWMCHIKDAILNNSQANVFIVDWSGGAKPMLPIDYSQSVTNTKYVSEAVSLFLKTLMQLSNQKDANRIQLIGHSLGAHISGFIGYSMNGTVGRITALDPAGPCFGSKSLLAEATSSHGDGSSGNRGLRYRLSPSSAELVIALHTDSTLFGLDENCAHFDVWVNGGAAQPKCPSLSLKQHLNDLLTGNLANTFSFDLTCAHSYSHDIMDILIPVTDNMFNSLLNSTLSSSNNKNETNVEGDGDNSLLASSSSPTDGFNNYQDEDEAESEQIRDILEKCYPIAYECRSWQAYKAGECGYCQDGEPSCVFIGGLGLDDQELAMATDLINQENDRAYLESLEEANKMDKYENNDTSFNGERETTFKDDDNNHSGSAAISDLTAKAAEENKNSQGRHFIKSGPDSPYCLYSYQVVIAVRALSEAYGSDFDRNRADKKNYYLQMPLDAGGVLVDPKTSGRLRDRLVKVSHRVNQVSPAHTQLADKFVKRMQDLGYTELNNNNNTDFYTSLITFRSTSDEDKNACLQDSSVNGNDTLHLCSPVPKINEARLWSSTADRLEQVEWVSLNYMSGINEKLRFKYSQLLKLRSKEDIIKFDNNSNSGRPSIDELEAEEAQAEDGPGAEGAAAERRKPKAEGAAGSATSELMNNLAPLNVAQTVLSPIDCALSTINPNESGSSANNLKCGQGLSELKYTALLRSMNRRGRPERSS